MTESKKKLVAGKLETLTTRKKFFPYDEELYGKTSYQIFCPKCNHGPMQTAETGLLCQGCGRKLIVVRMNGGDYKVVIIE